MSADKHIPSEVEYLAQHASSLAELLQKHRGRIVIFTGAGVSTSANIPDYRGTNGLWRAQITPTKGKKKKNPAVKLRLPEATFAQPTFTHMAIAALVTHGFVRHIVSQNVDGLHLRSGIPRDRLSELHGNLFIEQCIACDQVVYRSFDVGETTAKSRHLTGRICPHCSSMEESRLPISRLSEALAQETHAFLESHKKDTKSPRLLQVLAVKHAAQRLVRTTPKSSPTPPLLRDVIVHYYEKQPQAGLSVIYRIRPALEAIYGSRVVSAMESNSKGNSSQAWPEHLKKTLKRIHQAEPKEGDDSPASLILVLGSSLTVLRNYSFLWPGGLGKCAHAEGVNKKIKKPRRVSSSGDSETAVCQLAIVNLQPTCKDGIANFVCRLSCDDLLREMMENHLHLPVPEYQMERDQLLQWAVPLQPKEECTRIRPDISMH